MEQKFNNNQLDLQVLREFCEREGEEIAYRKGDQLEREGDPARWFAFVTEGCFKYVKYGVSDDKVFMTYPLEVVKREGNIFTFAAEIAPTNAGEFKIAFRMYPNHEELPHRMDFAYVKWFA